MQIQCNHCGQLIPSSNINLEHKVAKCDNCDSITHLEPPRANTGGQIIEPEKSLAKPSGLHIDEQSDHFRMVKPWFNGTYVGLLIFSLFFTGFPQLLFHDEIQDLLRGRIRTDDLAPFLIFGIGFSTIGLCTFYASLAGILNRTVYTLDFNQLRVKHGPLPWFGNKKINPSEITKFTVKTSSVEVNGQPRYNVFADTINKKSILIAPRIETKNAALYIKQQLDKQTGLAKSET